MQKKKKYRKLKNLLKWKKSKRKYKKKRRKEGRNREIDK